MNNIRDGLDVMNSAEDVGYMSACNKLCLLIQQRFQILWCKPKFGLLRNPPLDGKIEPVGHVYPSFHVGLMFHLGKNDLGALRDFEGAAEVDEQLSC